MEKYIESIQELNLSRKINSGSCSEIYLYKPGIYFKYFNEDYRDLTDKINVEFLEVIKTISDIKDIPSIIKAIDIYHSGLELFGYTMYKIKASTLGDVSDDTLILDLIDAFKRLKQEIEILSNHYVRTEDIGGDNILYNGNIYLIDLDLSLVDRNYIPEELYIKTTYNVFKSLHLRITGEIYQNDGLYEYRQKLYLGNNDEHINYFKKLIELCSDKSGKEIKTLGDVRKVYQKIYK